MILVTGSTGSNGTEIVTRLAARHVPVRAMVRHPGQASVIALPHVEVVGGDFDRPAALLTRAYRIWGQARTSARIPRFLAHH